MTAAFCHQPLDLVFPKFQLGQGIFHIKHVNSAVFCQYHISPLFFEKEGTQLFFHRSDGMT